MKVRLEMPDPNVVIEMTMKQAECLVALLYCNLSEPDSPDNPLRGLDAVVVDAMLRGPEPLFTNPDLKDDRDEMIGRWANEHRHWVGS